LIFDIDFIKQVFYNTKQTFACNKFMEIMNLHFRNIMYPKFERISFSEIFVVIMLLAGFSYAQLSVPDGFFRINNSWILASKHGNFVSSKATYWNSILDNHANYSLSISGSYPALSHLNAGFCGDISADRFFTEHYWSVWFGSDFFRAADFGISFDLTGYGFNPGDASFEDSGDPIAYESQSVIKPSISAGFAATVAPDIDATVEFKNILKPDMALAETYSSPVASSLLGGLSWRIGSVTAFFDSYIFFDTKTEYDISGGLLYGTLDNKLKLKLSAGNRMINAGAGYDLGEIAIGYVISRQLGDAGNIGEIEHSFFVELSEVIETQEIVLDTVKSFPKTTSFIPEWLIVKKKGGVEEYKLSLKCDEYDSVLFHYSPDISFAMDDLSDGLWTIDLPEIPVPASWLIAYRGESEFFLKTIYSKGGEAARMTTIIDEYCLLVSFGELSQTEKDTIKAYAKRSVPFYLDSENPDFYEIYLNIPGADRFYFAAPGFSPQPPKIRLASEFAVEKVDNRLHAVIVVSIGRLPHRLIATSDWTGDFAVNSNNSMDTLIFIVPRHVPDTIPVIVTGTTTDPWFRVHRIGPDTLDNIIMAKVWENTDYTLFNYIYYAEDNRHCKGDIDPKLERLISQTIESNGKLLITGNRYRDAKCAYDYARQVLPATQVRIDPALVADIENFSSRWLPPDSLWFINNFSQAIVEWKTAPLPEDIAGYVVYVDTKPIPDVKSPIEIAHLKLNSEPVASNMFILNGLIPENNYYVRITPETGDGRLGKLSSELIVRTKARRKTVVYEFSSKLGNPSAFDFSEYSEISMHHSFAQQVDLYLGTDALLESLGNLMLKSPSMVFSARPVWKNRAAGILFMDTQPLDSPYDAQEITTAPKNESEQCRTGARYLVRTPDGYELIIRVESAEGIFPDRSINIQYLYRLIETAPIFDWQNRK